MPLQLNSFVLSQAEVSGRESSSRSGHLQLRKPGQKTHLQQQSRPGSRRRAAQSSGRLSRALTLRPRPGSKKLNPQTALTGRPGLMLQRMLSGKQRKLHGQPRVQLQVSSGSLRAMQRPEMPRPVRTGKTPMHGLSQKCGRRPRNRTLSTSRAQPQAPSGPRLPSGLRPKQQTCGRPNLRSASQTMAA